MSGGRIGAMNDRTSRLSFRSVPASENTEQRNGEPGGAETTLGIAVMSTEAGRDGDLGLRWALRAFRGSVDQLNAAIAASDEAAMFRALAECAWWAISIDDGLEEQAGYKDRRNAHPDGVMLRGVRYIRNLIGHHRVFAVRHQRGLTFPLRFPLSWGGTYWLTSDQLPEADGQRDGNKRLRPYYDQHLADRSPSSTFAAVGKWFDSQRLDGSDS